MLWLAQLSEPIIEILPGCFNVDRAKCRYFVRTDELAGFPHALEWWQQRGQGLRLADEDAALARAAASDGVHFSFEKTDHVTRSTICGRFEPTSIFEQSEWRNELVSFATTELTLAAARDAVSAGLEDQSDQQSAEREVVRAAAEAAELAARATAAERAASAFAELEQKRKEGKAREQQLKEEKAKKKQRS